MIVSIPPAPEPTRAAQDKAAGLCCRCHSRKIAPGSESRCEVCLEKERLHYYNQRNGIIADEPDDGTITLSLVKDSLTPDELAFLEQLARDRGLPL